MAETLEMFNSLLRLAVENGASDIHIKSDRPAVLRLDGHLEPIDMDPMPMGMVVEFIESSCPPQFIERWRKESQIDYCYAIDEIGRFRVNGFFQRGRVSMVFRHVKEHPPTFTQLNHDPKVFKQLAKLKDGIVLVCGATGSGKSSTLAAMLDYINNTYDKHIVTLEDPIEFNYADAKCVINQREVGIDTPSFQLGLRAVLRQDPDIILIGEMRDQETFDTALSAAETGHLVFGTLHASNAQQAIQRLFEFYPPDQIENMRRQIGEALKATICQKLIPALEGSGRVPAVEIFVVDSLGRKVIEEGNYEKIPSVVEATQEAGSKSFNQDLYRLIKAGRITKDDGLAFSPNPKALEMNLKGIFLSTGGIVG